MSRPPPIASPLIIHASGLYQIGLTAFFSVRDEVRTKINTDPS
ncbi:hypothetical protein OOU_Y34scaffold00979g18 [Pyricularia oryzae Y34]|uniref:Uncharacterized protein n=3 Tax=Pyricularia oryzae TaxID=318829 RepID=A0A4P7N2V2_PYROR|nr:hypothetical protein OOU_Y34scaffold00979g18 [Pyricularia oryzae Y34]QBZ55311.1 hypothetical protein PoMZ_00207 [Pyricularia oryzae]